MPKGHSARHHLEGDPVNPSPHSHVDIAGVHAS